jgi:hypothetical protein
MKRAWEMVLPLWKTIQQFLKSQLVAFIPEMPKFLGLYARKKWQLMFP